MKTYSITYIDHKKDKACKGVTIEAKNESKALKKFKRSHKGAEFKAMAKNEQVS